MTEVKRPLSLHLACTSRGNNSPATDGPVTSFSSIKRAALGGGASPRPTRAALTKSSSISSTKTNCSATSTSSTSTCSSGYDSPDSPSLILPYLYVGDQAQTQIDTISNLNIKYILSLQSLPKFLDTSSAGGCGGGGGGAGGCTSKSSVITADIAKALVAQTSTTSSQLANSNNNNKSETYQPQKQPGTALIRRVDGDEVEIQTQLSGSTSISQGGDRLHQQSIDGAGQALTSTAGNGAPSSLVTSSSNSSPSDDDDDDGAIARELLPSANSSKDYLVKFKSCVNKLIKGKCINISDTFETLVDKFFDETHNFIEEARRNKCNILVHCKAGISRSPTIAIAYLMKWKRLHLQEAYEFVKQCRPQISPNLNFMGQLMNYERQLLRRGAHHHQQPMSCPGLSMLPSPLSYCLPGPSQCNAIDNNDEDERMDPNPALTSGEQDTTTITKTHDDLNATTSDNDSNKRAPEENRTVSVTA